MKLSAILSPLIAAGVSGDIILATVKAFEEQQNDALERRREADRRSTSARRARMDVTEAEWNRLRAIVIERDGYACTYCGCDEPDPQADHIVPLSRGGFSVIENLCATCKPCNVSKGPRLLSEWRGR